MGLLNDHMIYEYAREGMIKPFVAHQVSNYWNENVLYDNVIHGEKDSIDHTPLIPCISYGISSYGYDMRVAGAFKIFTNYWPGIIDPKAFNSNAKFHEVEVIESFADAGFDNSVIIPPNSFALARSYEYFRMPREILALCIGKSTYARCGIVVNVTAFEPEWEGHVTIEISNTTPLPAKIYAFEGIAQVIFFEADEVCEVSYADKKGKYQGQTGITLPKV